MATRRAVLTGAAAAALVSAAGTRTAASQTAPSLRDAAAESLPSPASAAVLDVAAHADIATLQMPPPVGLLRTAGYHLPGDGGGGHYRRAGAEPPHAGRARSADGAWWELVADGRISPEQFGARGDAESDDADAFARMFSYVASTGAGVRCAPRVYLFAAPLDLPDRLDLEGSPGTVLDFSAVAEWSWGTGAGLMTARGRVDEAGARRLLADAWPARRVPVASARRAGGVVSVRTEIPHGLETGDAVHIGGAGSATPAEQLAFFTMGGTSTRTYTEPVIVTRRDERTFSFAATGPGDRALDDDTAWVEAGGPLLRLDSVDGLAPGDLVFVSADDLRTDGRQKTPIGEILQIKHVHPATGTLVTVGGVREGYRVASNARLVRIEPSRNIRLRNFRLRGKGPNTGAGYGDRGIHLDWVDGFEIAGIEIERVDQMGILAWASVNGEIRGNTIRFDASDEAGRLSDELDIQYGIAFGNGTRAVRISGNVVYGGRHAIVESSTSTRAGVARDIAVVGNTVYGTWLAAISTHQAADTLLISGNVLSGCHSGVNLRYGDFTDITENLIVDCTRGVELYNRVGGTRVRGNRIRATELGITIHAPLSLDDIRPDLDVSENAFERCERGIRCRIAMPGAVARNWTFDGNSFRDIGLGAIEVRVGDLTNGRDHWTGSVSRNRIDGAGLHRPEAAIALYNPVDVDVMHNSARSGAGAVESRIVIGGASAAGCRIGWNSGDGTDAISGSGHVRPLAVRTYVLDAFDAPPIPANGAIEVAIPAPGVRPGASVMSVACSADPGGLVTSGRVERAGVVTAFLHNLTAAPVDLPRAAYTALVQEQ